MSRFLASLFTLLACSFAFDEWIAAERLRAGRS